MIVRVVVVLVGLLAATRARAQTPCTSPSPQTTPPTFTCQTAPAHTARWDYTAEVLAGDVFRLYVNGLQVGADIPAQMALGVTVDFGGAMTPGTYTVAVSLVRPSTVVAESARTPVTLVVVSPNPSPPTNLRIVEVIMRGLDGAGTVLWEHIERMTASVTP